MVRIIVAGGRDFNDFDKLSKTLDGYICALPVNSEITIISGGARGADSLGERYANIHRDRIKLQIIPANWDKFGKSAGYRRNEEMAKIATDCICFWDGQSRGTQHMIHLAKQYNLKTTVISY